MQKYFRFLLFFLSFWTLRVEAQEFTGLNVGNFKGVDAITANPSLALLQRSWLDIRLAGVGLFAENTYVYIPRADFNLTDLLRKNYQFPRYGEYARPVLASAGSRLFYAYTDNRLLLPAVLYSDMSRRFAIAISLQSRFAGGAERIPYDVANFSYYGLDYSRQHRIEYNDFNISGSSLAWSEIGVTVARVLRRERFDLWTAGVTFKYLLGHSGFYARMDNVRYIVLNDSTINIRNLTGEAAFAVPMNYNTNTFPGGQPYILGKGLGFDVGFTFLKTPREIKRLLPQRVCQTSFDDYVWRLGVSLLDVGAITFLTNAQKHRITNTQYFWENANQISYQNVQEAVNDFSTRLTGSPQGTLVDTIFSIGLPTALSIQYDRKLEGHWYIYAGALKALPLMGDAAIHRPDQVMLIPRYETRYFEAAFPLTMYRLVRPRLGLSLRFGTFTLGTDNLGGFIRQGNFKSADLYFSLRISLRKGHCWYGKPSDPCYSTY
ncbi:MAG: DUF5723 family protein [Bacteroidales bacterium]